MVKLPTSVTVEAAHDRIPLFQCVLPNKCIRTAEDFRTAVRQLLIPSSPDGAAIVVPAGAVDRESFDPEPLGVVDFEHGGAGFHHHQVLEVALVSSSVRESVGTLVSYHEAVVEAASNFLSAPQEQQYVFGLAGSMFGNIVEQSVSQIRNCRAALPERYSALRTVLALPFGQQMYRIYRGIQNTLGDEVLAANWQQNDICLIRRDNVHARDVRQSDIRTDPLSIRCLKTRLGKNSSEQVTDPVQSE